MEFLRGVLEGLVSYWVISLCTGGAVVTLAALRRYRPQWAPIVLYGFAGFVGVFTLFLLAEGQKSLLSGLRDEIGKTVALQTSEEATIGNIEF